MNMTLTFLGTGTSCGTPVVGCECRVCRSPDPKDIRTRASAMVETDTTRVVIDCGPDFRQQMLRQPFRKIDGILITHHHYDHVGGLAFVDTRFSSASTASLPATPPSRWPTWTRR